MPCVTELPLSVALSGPESVASLERAALDFVTFADPSHALAAAAVTRRIGLVTTGSPTDLTTLDDVSPGRAGWLTPGASPAAAALPAAVITAVEAPPTLGTPGPASDALGAGVAKADVVFVPAADAEGVRAAVAAVRSLRAEAGTAEVPYRVFADLPVSFAGTTPARLAALLSTWQRAGADGFRLHPADPVADLARITGGLVPHLRENDALRRGYEVRTLRALLRLPGSRSQPVSAS